jgi:predicted RNA-binding Zn ribbon-like protein
MDEELLLTLLNSTPVIDGVRTDILDLDVDDPDLLRAGRDVLQAVVRGECGAAELTPYLEGVVSRPLIDDDGHLAWVIEADGVRAVLVSAVSAWDEVRRTRPGRLRACANDECARFLLDRSRSNSARWCSMAVCGNRLKARRHHRRITSEARPPGE